MTIPNLERKPFHDDKGLPTGGGRQQTFVVGGQAIRRRFGKDTGNLGVCTKSYGTVPRVSVGSGAFDNETGGNNGSNISIDEIAD